MIDYGLENVLSYYGFNHIDSVNIAKVLYLSGSFEEGFLDESCKYICEKNQSSYYNIPSDDSYLLCDKLVKVAIDSKCNAADSYQVDNVKILQHCDTESLLQNFIFPSFAHAHDWIIQVTQKKLFARTGERWESNVPKWINTYQSDLLELVNNLGFCREVLPGSYYAKMDYDMQCKHISFIESNCDVSFGCGINGKESADTDILVNKFDVVAVFGATKEEIDKRLYYLKNILTNESYGVNLAKAKIYLLAGERYVNYNGVGVMSDGGKEYLTNLADKLEKDVKSLTESDLILEAAERIIGYSKYEFKIIDTPRYNKSRPNTFDTIDLFTLTKSEDENSVLFISRSPNQAAQAETTYNYYKNYLPRICKEITNDKNFKNDSNGISNRYEEVCLNNIASSMKFEVIGGNCSVNEAKLSNALYNVMMPFAGALYGGYIRVAKTASD